MTTEEIYDRWEPIAFHERHGVKPEDRLPLWEELFRDCRSKGGWSCSLDGAFIITVIGCSLLLQAGHPERTLKVARAGLGHPELKAAKRDNHVTIHLIQLDGYIADALVLLGRKKEAYQIWIKLLNLASQSGAHNVRLGLCHMLRSEPEGVPDEDTRKLASALIGRFHGAHKIAKQVICVKDNQGLFDLVDLMRGGRVRPR